MRKTLYDYRVSEQREELLVQWDQEKNGALTPKDITYGSKRKIWWRCEKGHSWQAVVHTRTTGRSGCPYCMERVLTPGEDSLLAKAPEIAAEWHPEKNGSLTPDQVHLRSHKKVWWKCEKGHEWQTVVKTRSYGAGCPVCKNRVVQMGKNDLATTHPYLLREWDFEKNKTISPNEVHAGAAMKVWWICQKGHSWQATISSRAHGNGCPVCAGKIVIEKENDLASAFPEIARQWNYERNGDLRPEQVTPYSNKSVWWHCENGHEYKAMIGHRVSMKSGCPYCAGKKVWPGFNDLKTKAPEVAAQWHPILNGKLTPETITCGSSKKVWWKCMHGHVWKAVIYTRTNGCGCPTCAGKEHNRYYNWVPGELEEKLLADFATNNTEV